MVKRFRTRSGKLRPPQQLGSDWLPTGDLAELDEGGNLHFADARKDVIVTAAGLNIHPRILRLPCRNSLEVKASAVIETVGTHGPEPLAVFVLRSGEAPAVIQRANQELAEFQKVRRWSVWPEPDLPRTSTGKILRREVARIINSSHPERQALAGSLTDLLQRIKRAPDPADGPGGPNGDLQLDSLSRVELQAGLEEQFGIVLDDAAIQNVRSEEDLRAFVHQAARSTLLLRRRAPAINTFIRAGPGPAWFFGCASFLWRLWFALWSTFSRGHASSLTYQPCRMGPCCCMQTM